MPLWVSLYVALMVVSLPVGVLMLRRVERDWLHPIGGLLSTLLSIAFVFSYWMPESVPFKALDGLVDAAFHGRIWASAQRVGDGFDPLANIAVLKHHA